MEQLEKEYTSCLSFFLKTRSEEEKTFGLVPDVFPSDDLKFSIAGTGYFFSALAIADHKGIISRKEAIDSLSKGLNTLNRLPKQHGFFHHFYAPNGEARNGSEISNIDTSILFLNLLVAASYFGGKESTRIYKLLDEANWPYFLDNEGKYFYMAINKDGGRYGLWDHYAEQLMIYILAAGSGEKKHQVGPKPYYSFIRDEGDYKGIRYIYSWNGSLFTYQFTQDFIDFRKISDKTGLNWFKNSQNASKADYEYCQSSNDASDIYPHGSFGLTSCMASQGYEGGYGAALMGEKEPRNNGTIPPCGALGSIYFTPKESKEAFNYYSSLKDLNGPYGLYDSFNLKEGFFAKNYVSIDKGITMIALANYLDNEFIYRLLDISPPIQRGLANLGFKKEG